MPTLSGGSGLDEFQQVGVDDVGDADLPALRAFTSGLRRDLAAVVAG